MKRLMVLGVGLMVLGMAAVAGARPADAPVVKPARPKRVDGPLPGRNDLLRPDATERLRAVEALVRAMRSTPEPTAEATPADPQQIAALIEQLGDDSWQQRDAASKALRQI